MNLKEAPMTPPVQTVLNATSHIALDTDDCTFKDVSVLLPQQEHETTKPKGYWSRSPTDAENKYDATL